MTYFDEVKRNHMKVLILSIWMSAGICKIYAIIFIN
jgi:hypothetical protein